MNKNIGPLLFLSALASCSSDPPPEPVRPLQVKQAVSEAVPCRVPSRPGDVCPEKGGTVSVRLPPGGDRSSFAAIAGTRLVVSDRVHVTDMNGAAAAIANTGGSETTIGADASVGSLSSISSVWLRERATVAGALRTGGAVTQQNGVSILGPVETYSQELTQQDGFSWQVAIPTQNVADVVIEPGSGKGSPSWKLRPCSPRQPLQAVVAGDFRK